MVNLRKQKETACAMQVKVFKRCSFYSELPCQVARGGMEGRGAAAPAAEKPMGGDGKVGEVGVVGDIVADFVFFSFTAGGTFS